MCKIRYSIGKYPIDHPTLCSEFAAKVASFWLNGLTNGSRELYFDLLAAMFRRTVNTKKNTCKRFAICVLFYSRDECIIQRKAGSAYRISIHIFSTLSVLNNRQKAHCHTITFSTVIMFRRFGNAVIFLLKKRHFNAVDYGVIKKFIISDKYKVCPVETNVVLESVKYIEIVDKKVRIPERAKSEQKNGGSRAVLFSLHLENILLART